MFDVIWTDPDRESVGERKQRKRMEGHAARKKEEERLLRTSVSTHSSGSSGGRTFGGMFSGSGLQHASSKKAPKQHQQPQPPAMSKAAKPMPTPFLQPAAIPREEPKIRFRDSFFGSSLSPISSSNGYSEGQSQVSDDNIPPDRLVETSAELSPGLDSRDSNTSKWTDHAITPTSTIRSPNRNGSRSKPEATSKIVQSLGPSSFITKTTEVSIEERSPEVDSEFALSDVSITADRRPPQMPPTTPPPPPSGDPQKAIQTKKWLSSIPNRGRPRSPPRSEPPPQRAAALRISLALGQQQQQQAATPPRLRLQAAPSGATIGAIGGRRTPPASPPPLPPALTLRGDNPDAWQPPDAWDCSPPASARAAAAAVPTSSMDAVLHHRQQQVGEEPDQRLAQQKGAAGTASSMSLDLMAMQREMKLMEAASPQTILTRLREDWSGGGGGGGGGGSSGGSQPDAALYREVEMEKKRWMLSAMFNVDRPAVAEEPEGDAKARTTKEKVVKILALFESQATASYLAAAHHDSFVYHMSPNPLSHDLFPNVIPTTLPVMSHLAVSLAPDMYSSVHSLSLPSLVPSSDIPPLLRSIRRTLVPGGVLHITLIDPAPVADSVGPKMRAWVEGNLQLNLERKFRCANPTKLFPGWLGDAGLRGDGSTKTTVKFYAVPPPAAAADASGGGDGTSPASPAPVAGAGALMTPTPVRPGTASSSNNSSGSNNNKAGGDADRETRTHLRSTVGRMLWMEVWGQFISVERWWWEEPDCVAECLELGTYWEYNLIEAAKEG